MIITKEEFIGMGFECSDENEELLNGCIKRTESILNALCGGRLYSVSEQSEKSSALIKQAAAFQADALMKSERSGDIKSCAIGDVSYTVGSETSAFDVEVTVKKLLCAAGCFRGAAAEVIE